ncbi:hydrogenase accessory protein [Bradyrhizobium sp. BRP22]|uniref:hydrogenase accessory protein n=1 Tax=Bradyrhizobium sp. BRP22 TaxID=2793821 RepID=UPI001CD3E0DA|nr:hydrogenase accessory protein [Bradyrhizobium sp. BRP22]MCA1455811.1 hydrogenase accessory protein [Bradyrhizobium sp. BRP22]
MEFQPEKRDLTRLRPSELGTANAAIGLAAADAQGRLVVVLLSDGSSAPCPQAIGSPILLPELIETLHGRLVGAVIVRDAEGELDRRFGVSVQPRRRPFPPARDAWLECRDQQIDVDRMSKLIGRSRTNGTSVLKASAP